MGLLKELHTKAESISLPVERALWQQIQAKEPVQALLRQQPEILLLGTDPKLSLVNEVFETHHIVAAAKENVPFGANIEFINQDLFELDPDRIKGNPRLAIAKHLIHFYDASLLVTQVASFLKEGGLFFATTPIGSGWKSSIELRLSSELLKTHGIKVAKEPLQGKFLKGGTLFCFSKRR